MKTTTRVWNKIWPTGSAALMAGGTGWVFDVPPSTIVALMIAVAALGLTLTFSMVQLRRRLSNVANASETEALYATVKLLDSLLADETRRSLEPTLTPWAYHAAPNSKSVLLLPGADYHLAEIMPIADELETMGIPVRVAVGEPHWARTGLGLRWYERTIYNLPTEEQLEAEIGLVLAMKDWAGYGTIIRAATALGIPTFSKVEGAQDFLDTDTGENRLPYRHADTALCQGENDYQALADHPRVIVGSTRLERLWRAPHFPPLKPLAAINLNFTYGVQSSARKEWLDSAIEGCRMAGLPYVLAIHPAERPPRAVQPTTTVSISRVLPHCTALISRFSTVPFEAMARGVGFVYHNPHGERVPVFQYPQGAFAITTTASELSQGLIKLPNRDSTPAVEAFFRQQVDIQDDPSEVRSARVISSAMI